MAVGAGRLLQIECSRAVFFASWEACFFVGFVSSQLPVAILCWFPATGLWDRLGFLWSQTVEPMQDYTPTQFRAVNWPFVFVCRHWSIGHESEPSFTLWVSHSGPLLVRSGRTVFLWNCKLTETVKLLSLIWSLVFFESVKSHQLVANYFLQSRDR